MKTVLLAVLVLGTVSFVFADVEPAVTPECHQTTLGTSTFASWDFFTNYGSYLPRIHCIRNADGTPDWPWITTLLFLNLTVMVGYLKIFVFWRRCYLAETPSDRNTKLMDLAWIFLLCATCGYAMFVVTLFWPSYRLLAFFMVALSYFTWRFAGKLGDFKISFSAKRLQRELHEHLQKRNEELAHLVAQRTRELEQANKFKQNFLANMSHEIRTPMTSILGFSELLLDRDLSGTERQEFVNRVRRNGQHLLGLINDVLDMSKIEAGKLIIERRACNVIEIVDDVVKTLERRAADRGVKLSMRCEMPFPREITSDTLRVRQVVTNLLSNALKFTQDGEVTVNLAFVAASGQVRISVRDTGCGIAPDQIDRIFRPFEQASPSTSRQYGGTGLGLPISRELARLMGGDLTVESTDGAGSTFTFSIDPGDLKHAIWVQSVEAASEPVPLQGVPTGRRLEGVRILVADDAVDIQMMLRTLLERWGASVHLVDDGKAAIEAAHAETSRGRPFDLILMDMQMPGTDGLIATRKLRESGYAGPIIALTANVLSSDREHCLSAGCDDYSIKPISAHSLLEIIWSRLGIAKVA